MDRYSFLQLTAENPAIKAKFLRDYCASAHYIMTILLKGYKFNSTWDQISFEKQVRNTVSLLVLMYCNAAFHKSDMGL